MGGKELELKKRKISDPNIGYQMKFKYNIDMNSNGIPGECIEWCEHNCSHKWGWWFESTNDPVAYYNNHWEDQRAFMSFENKREASAFLIAVGIQNMENNKDN